ncbi:hypothetical protein SO802_020527 [Lithocarpus litseifolius]|uniref:RPN1 N-terminal domain-containing protein n=1 Tax=Lithocarpus litseifolius TaxID=425828 RepID=A0AAW2CCD4_9ROSI
MKYYWKYSQLAEKIASLKLEIQDTATCFVGQLSEEYAEYVVVLQPVQVAVYKTKLGSSLVLASVFQKDLLSMVELDDMDLVMKYLADILSVLALTMSAEGERESLKYRLEGSGGDIGSWGHEYVRNLAGETSQEYAKPQVMAVSESSRLRASLKKENALVKRLIVNQILPPSASDCKFCAMKRKDQSRALDMIRDDTELSSLELIQAPLVDVELRGVPALKFLGDVIGK